MGPKRIIMKDKNFIKNMILNTSAASKFTAAPLLKKYGHINTVSSSLTNTKLDQ